ncbi:MAG: virulence factor, partial [Caldilineaceae bacterium]|nr:virulence factor [Caldilineaceae bacterium]
MATYQILYWFDIPVQVKAAIGRNRRTVPLTDRFSEAVDAAAMASGLIGSDAYTEQ